MIDKETGFIFDDEDNQVGWIDPERKIIIEVIEKE